MMLVCTLLAAQCAWAYEVETHARFSQQAATCSVLADPALMEGLGLDGLEVEDRLWQKPVDIHDPDWIGKWIKEYNKAENKYKPTIKTLIGWGAKFEDEEFKERPLNHFFDPLDGRPIHPCPPFSTCNTSPDWSLEDGWPQPDLGGQANSLFDANNHLGFAIGLVSKDDRDQAWGDLFQTLGMAIHHVQDMSQPQHVRNDAHCDGDEDGVVCYGFHLSYYEKCTNADQTAFTTCSFIGADTWFAVMSKCGEMENVAFVRMGCA